MVRKRLKWIIPVVLAAVLAAVQEISVHLTAISEDCYNCSR